MKNFLGGLALGITLLLIAVCYQYSGALYDGADAQVPFEFKIPADPNPPLPPVQADEVVELDGKDRTYSARLSKIAQVTADNMAAGQAHRYRDFRGFHTRFVPATLEKHGECRENICWVGGTDSWETAYNVWKNSPQHEFNRQNGGPVIGYAKATNGGYHYYVVLYGSKP